MTLIFDTETTGLVKHPAAKDSVQPQIIEWAGVLVDTKGNVANQWDVLINPGRPLPEEIVKITGSTDEMLKGEKPFVKVMGKVRLFYEWADRMISHNLPFDKGMMDLELARAGVLG